MELVKRITYRNVAMVNGRINDVEALVGANMGIAVGDLSVVFSVANVTMLKGVNGLSKLFSKYRIQYMSNDSSFNYKISCYRYGR